MYQGNCNVPTWGRDTSGNVTGLVGPDGTPEDLVANTAGFVYDLSMFKGFDPTGVNDQSDVFQAAVTALEAVGYGTLHIPPGIYNCDSSIIVRGGNPTLNGGYQGGIEICGSGKTATVINFSSTKGFIFDCGEAPTHGSNSAMAICAFRDMHIKGPGKGVSGSVGIDVSPQGDWQSTPNDVTIDNVWFEDWENPLRFDDATCTWVRNCYFLEYVKGIRFGYNHDTMVIEQNRFGNNQTIIGSQTETALAWDFISPHHSGATSLSGAQNHYITNNWFMRQLLVADIWDPTASNITFQHNQYESCRHYAQLGNASTSTTPTRIIFDRNVFMRTDGQDETQAKIKVMHASGAGFIELVNNTNDSSTGPKYGWVTGGSASTVRFWNNTLSVAGVYVVNPYHLMVGGKNIALSVGDEYIFRPGTGNRRIQQWNASGNDNVPYEETATYNATDLTIYQRWTNRAAASESTSGNSLDIIQRSVSGTRYAMLSGASVPLQGAALPTAASQLRGMQFLVQGGAGVADVLYVCMKSAADTYSWVAV